ncbi:MAG: hypothetical protein ACKOW3_03265 [Hyphomicrobium sp.]
MISWLGGILLTGLNLAWSLIWFLVGGWFSTLAQIGVLFSIVYFYKYGWQRAPAEIIARLMAFLRFVWNWIRQKDITLNHDRRDIIRIVKVKEFGDINLSSLLNALLFFNLILFAFY